MNSRFHRTWPFRLGAALAGLVALYVVPSHYCGRDASAWFEGSPDLARALAEEHVHFEAEDDRQLHQAAKNRFEGEWALVTHQMTALGFAQLCLAHPDWALRYAPVATRAALKSMAPEMRDFGTAPWKSDALATLASSDGHAYLGYSALAVSMARLVDPHFPAADAKVHDALIAAYERRLLASKTGLIETYPGQAFPTDVSAVAAAIAVHGRATHASHDAVLRHWIAQVRRVQIDPESGLFIQRMDARTGARKDVPRGSGTGLGAYFAGFVDRELSQQLSDALFRHQTSFLGFGAIREYADGFGGHGDVDSGPVLLGVSVAATGFALGPARSQRRAAEFERLYRTAELFGLRLSLENRTRFATGGPIGNALMFALLTSGPEVLP